MSTVKTAPSRAKANVPPVVQAPASEAYAPPAPAPANPAPTTLPGDRIALVVWLTGASVIGFLLVKDLVWALVRLYLGR